MGSAASSVESVCLDPELKRDLLLRAPQSSTSVSRRPSGAPSANTSGPADAIPVAATPQPQPAAAPAGGSCPGTTTAAGEAVGGRPEPSADLLRQLDDDPLPAADVAEPIAVFVALHLANELRAAGSQASDDGVDVLDCEVADRLVGTRRPLV